MQCARVVLQLLWPVWLYHVFPHYFINGTIFGKNVTEYKNAFSLSLHILSETFLILKRIQQDTINGRRSSTKEHVILVGF